MDRSTPISTQISEPFEDQLTDVTTAVDEPNNNNMFNTIDSQLLSGYMSGAEDAIFDDWQPKRRKYKKKMTRNGLKKTVNKISQAPYSEPTYFVPQKSKPKTTVATRVENIIGQPVNDNDELCQLDIGNDCYVVAKPFKGEILVHVRKYGKQNDGGLFPTKKGIALSLEKWKKLEEWKAQFIDEEILKYRNNQEVDYMAHLGGNYYVTLKKGYPCVNIRRWFLPENQQEIVPTKTGIALSFDQWEKVKLAMILVRDLLKNQLDNITFCEFTDSHAGQLGALRCSNCNPNTYMDY